MNPVDRFVVERPSAPLRRRQVLDAAEACFLRGGFHATSMAEIAAAAAMSVGHIYRYFAGKDDIVVAIVQDYVSLATSEMAALETQHADSQMALRGFIERTARRLADPQRGALFLEIMAEAARNAKVAEIMRSTRKVESNCLKAMIARAYPSYSPDKIDRRVEVLGIFLESIAFRSVISPDLICDTVINNLTGCLESLLIDWGDCQR